MKHIITFLVLLITSQHLLAQGNLNPKYLVSNRLTVGSNEAEFLNSLPHPLVPPDEWVISEPALQTLTAAIRLSTVEFQELSNNHRDYIIEQDQRMQPNSCETPDPVTGWALQHLLASHPCGLPKALDCTPAQVTLYVVDSGVQKTVGMAPHPQFGAGSPVVWGNGLMTPSLTGSGASPFIDLHDHGTGVASTAVGKDTGLFAHLHGGSVVLEPCQIYFPSLSPPEPPWVSDAVNVVFLASVAHLARANDSCLTNDGSVLLFANRTVTAYSEIMERQLAEATKAGIVVITAAGNKASNVDPKTPPSSAPVAGCMGLFSQISPIPITTRTPSGLPLGAVLANPFFPCLTYNTPATDYLLTVGATAQDMLNNIVLWTSGPANGSNYGLNTHIYAHGGAVSKATNSGTISTGTGTSLSTGYVGGMALYYLSQRPWAKPPEVRSFILTNTVTTITPPGDAEVGTVIKSLSLGTLTAPDCCLAYGSWTSLRNLTALMSPQLSDPDNDGLVNLLEYALGNDPNTFSNNRGLEMTYHDGNYYLKLTLASYEVCDCTVTVEASFDLQSWTAPVPIFVSIPQVGSCPSKISEALITPSPSKKFFRIRVTTP